MPHSLLIDGTKTDESPEAATTTKPPATMKLDQLPEVILRRVFEFLLSTEEVRQPASADDGYVVKYHFHPAILRVNKSIHFLAQRVFHLNHFVMASTNWNGLTETIEGCGVWMWRDNLAKFKQYHARFNIKARGTKDDTLAKYRFFLICLDQVEGFARALHMFELGSELPITLKFEIKPGVTGADSSMPLMRQHNLLNPFIKIQGMKQTCSVSGAADLTLAKRVEASMSPKLRRWRFSCTNFKLANQCWRLLLAFCYQVQFPIRTNATSADANLCTSRQRLINTTCINNNLAKLYLGWTEDEDSWYEQVVGDAGHANFPPQPSMSATDLALSRFAVAVAAFALRKTAIAHRMLSVIVREAPDLVIYQQGLEAVSLWIKDVKIKKKTRNQRAETVALLLDLLPNEPLPSPKYLDNPVESQLAFESYVLEKLGYEGDKLTWLVEHAGHDFDDPQILNKKEAGAFVEERKKELANGGSCVIIGGPRTGQPLYHNHPPIFGFALPVPGPNSGMTPEVIRNMADMLFG